MKKFISDIGGTKTGTVYFQPLVFDSYEIVELPDEILSCFTNNSHVASKSFPMDNRFIIGHGFPTWAKEPAPDQFTYEWQSEVCMSSNDTAFLQSVLTFGAKIVKGKNRVIEIGEREIHMAMKFTEKYGLENDRLYDVCLKNGLLNPYHKNGLSYHPDRHGCSLWGLLRSIQHIYIAWESMNKIRENPNGLRDIDLLRQFVCSATVTTNFSFSSEQNKFIEFLSATSLLGIAQYQLGVAMSEGVYIRKCANPECYKMFWGRKDKKTCSDACRQAVSRLLRGADPHASK